MPHVMLRQPVTNFVQARCDGAYPFCTNCKSTKQKCVYDKPASIAYVRYLERQVESLEQKLLLASGSQLDESPGIPTGYDRDFQDPQRPVRREMTEGLEFNMENLISAMSDIQIAVPPAIDSNTDRIPFDYISQTLKYSHYLDGPVYKEVPDNVLDGTQLIKLVSDFRASYATGALASTAEKHFIKDFLAIGRCIGNQGFVFFRPHYINKYYRDFGSLLEATIPVIMKYGTRSKIGVDSNDFIYLHYMACTVYYRSIVVPPVNVSIDPEEEKRMKMAHKAQLDEIFAVQKKTINTLGTFVFSEVNSSLVQTCLVASISEVMLKDSLETAVVLSNFACRTAIQLFERYNSEMDRGSALWFLRIVWACYIWDKVISSCCNTHPVFPEPPPISPSEMLFNAMDTLPLIDTDGRMIAQIDARPLIIAGCRLSVVLSDIILRRHAFTAVRVQLYAAIDSVWQSVQEELTPNFTVPWDKPVIDAEMAPLNILPQHFPAELILPVAMTIVMKLELYTESFVNFAETEGTTSPNRLENKHVVFQEMVKYVKIAGSFARFISDIGPYGNISSAVAYINPWYRLQIMKSLYKFLMCDEAVKLLVLLTDEVPSDEIDQRGVVPKYEFVHNPNNVILIVPQFENDDSLPPDEFIQRIVFPFNSSTSFKGRPTRGRYYYLKYTICTYINFAQACVKSLSSFKSPHTRQMLLQSLASRPAVMSVFNAQRENVIKAVSLLPEPHFDIDLIPEFSYVRLMEMVHQLGAFGEILLREKKYYGSEGSRSVGSKSSTSSVKRTPTGNSPSYTNPYKRRNNKYETSEEKQEISPVVPHADSTAPYMVSAQSQTFDNASGQQFNTAQQQFQHLQQLHQNPMPQQMQQPSQHLMSQHQQQQHPHQHQQQMQQPSQHLMSQHQQQQQQQHQHQHQQQHHQQHQQQPQQQQQQQPQQHQQQHIPRQQIPTAHRAPQQMPSQAMPSQQMPSQQMPSQQMPSQQMPSQQMPSQQIPSQQMPSQQTPSQQIPSQQMQHQQIPQHVQINHSQAAQQDQLPQQGWTGYSQQLGFGDQSDPATSMMMPQQSQHFNPNPEQYSRISSNTSESFRGQAIYPTQYASKEMSDQQNRPQNVIIEPQAPFQQVDQMLRVTPTQNSMFSDNLLSEQPQTDDSSISWDLGALNDPVAFERMNDQVHAFNNIDFSGVLNIQGGDNTIGFTNIFDSQFTETDDYTRF